MEKKQLFIGISLFLVMGMSILSIHLYQVQLANPLHMLKAKEGKEEVKGTDRIKMVLNLGGSNSLGLKVAIPYEHMEQFNELWKRHPKIKNDLLMRVEPDSVDEWIHDRNFAALKGSILKVINSHLTQPVKTLYLESFFYE